MTGDSRFAGGRLADPPEGADPTDLPNLLDLLALLDPSAGGGPGVGSPATPSRVLRGARLAAALPRPPVGLTPHREIHRHDKLRVLYYPPEPGGTHEGVPLLFVPSLVNRAWILDLEPGRSPIRALAWNGHPVYLLDWGEPGPEDADEGMAYFLDTLLHHAVARVCRHAGVPRLALFGYCMGGTLAAMYTALHPRRVAGLMTLCAPARFSQGGRLRSLVAEPVVDLDAVIPPGRLVPVEVLRQVFRCLHPMGPWEQALGLERAARDPRTLFRFLARYHWIEENVPIPGAFAREFVQNGYREDRLLEGTWPVGARIVDLRRIEVPLTVLSCRKDPVVPPESARPLAAATASDDVREVCFPTGHVRIVVGASGPRHLYPLLHERLRSL